MKIGKSQRSNIFEDLFKLLEEERIFIYQSNLDRYSAVSMRNVRRNIIDTDFNLYLI